MCEFCHKHGEGRRWYLEARNYSDDLLSDLRRRRFVQEFFAHPENLARGVARLEQLERAPAPLRGLIRWAAVARQKSEHFGQVVPIEEVERIFALCNSIVRVPCICRHVTLGDGKRYCYGIGLGPKDSAMAELLGGLDGSFLNGPEVGGLERVDAAEALAAFRQYERDGLCHSVWTFRAPFIGGLCNCDRDCLAMRTTVTQGFPTMFRAEYVASVLPDPCDGCRRCMKLCQFGAMSYSAATRKVWIDPRRCYGCGICRSLCKPNAIQLAERTSVPAAASLW